MKLSTSAGKKIPFNKQRHPSRTNASRAFLSPIDENNDDLNDREQPPIVLKEHLSSIHKTPMSSPLKNDLFIKAVENEINPMLDEDEPTQKLGLELNGTEENDDQLVEAYITEQLSN